MVDKDLSDIEESLYREALESQELSPDIEVEFTPDGLNKRFRLAEPYFSLLEELAHIKGKITLLRLEAYRDIRLTDKQLHKVLIHLHQRGYIKLKKGK